MEGLVKLCIGLAEEALADGNKRSWEDVFGQLAPVCEAILEELEDKEVSTSVIFHFLAQSSDYTVSIRDFNFLLFFL